MLPCFSSNYKKNGNKKSTMSEVEVEGNWESFNHLKKNPVASEVMQEAIGDVEDVMGV
jgi:uncharacterized protein YaaN involved in tellurite resistance